MNSSSRIEQEIAATWERVKADLQLHEACRLDVPTLRARAEAESLAHCEEHLELWMALYDEGLHMLLCMSEAIEECFARSDKIITRAFVLLLARVTALTEAIRKLVIAGLEDAARPVTRAFLETLDLALVAFFDEEFAAAYADEAPYDANTFWKAEIAYGKLNRRLRPALSNAGLTEDEIDTHLTRRRNINGVLSDSVHSSFTSASRSYFVSSLKRPDRLRIAPLGHVSAHSPSLLSVVISEVHLFGAGIINSYANKPPPPLFRDVDPTPKFDSMLAAAFAFDQLVDRYDSELPPPFPWTDQEDSEDQ